MADYIFENHGSLYIVQPMTDEAREHLQATTGAESWQWYGGGLAVEHRFAQALAEGLEADGYGVEL